jgi:hypothetical protein
MTDTKNKNESPALTSRYRASEEEHRKFAREMEGELVISFTPNQTLPTPQAGSSMEMTKSFGEFPVLGEKQLKELGLWGDDELVVSLAPSRKLRPKASDTEQE